MGENAGLGRKMPFMDGHKLKFVPGIPGIRPKAP